MIAFHSYRNCHLLTEFSKDHLLKYNFGTKCVSFELGVTSRARLVVWWAGLVLGPTQPSTPPASPWFTTSSGVKNAGGWIIDEAALFVYTVIYTILLKLRVSHIKGS